MTWQEREKQRQAQEYLARAARRKETIRRAREYQKQTEHLNSQAQAATQQLSTMMGDMQSRRHSQPEPAEVDDNNSTYAFSQVSQRLAKPSTIPFERIQRTITTLQREFRRKKCERGSYLEQHNGHGDNDSECCMQQRARDTADFHAGKSMLIDETR